MKLYTLNKSERLKSRKQIQLLFKNGKAITQYPIRVIFCFNDNPESDIKSLAAFSVSKKKFSKAVERNKIKRLMREAYRLHKPTLNNKIPDEKQCRLMFIYLGNKIDNFQFVEKKIENVINQIGL